MAVVSLTDVELAALLGTDLPSAQRLLAVASELVNSYTDQAPQSIADEAALRCAGWLKAANAVPLRRISVGGIDVEYAVPGTRSALRASGAQSLLSPWKVRRAGAI